MSNLEIVYNPDSILRRGGRRVRADEMHTEEFVENVSRMFSIMYARGGIGLAAPQIGWHVNVFVINVRGRPLHSTHGLLFVNPKITTYGKLVKIKEGCLSIPGIEAKVTRPEKVHIEYDIISKDKERRSLDVKGMTSRVIQHEYDHLDGRLFIDRLTKKEKSKIKQELIQQAKNAIESKKRKIKKLKKLEEKGN